MPLGVSTEEFATPVVVAKLNLTQQSLQPPQLNISAPSALISGSHLHLPAPQQVTTHTYRLSTTTTSSSLRTTLTRPTTTRPHLSAAVLKQKNHIAATASRYSARARMIARRRATSTVGEYRNLRQSIPSLRRQRDIGKVEVVTEAARYIDHLHRTLIERFMLCGIPDSLKDLLGTSDARQLSPQHIMNLVTKMAAKQPFPAAATAASAHLQQQQQPMQTSRTRQPSTSARPRVSAPATRLNHSHSVASSALPVPAQTDRQHVIKASSMWLAEA